MNTSRRMHACDAAPERRRAPAASSASLMDMAEAFAAEGKRKAAAIRKQCTDDLSTVIAEDEARLAAQRSRVSDGAGMDAASENELRARIVNRLASNRATLDSLSGK